MSELIEAIKKQLNSSLTQLDLSTKQACSDEVARLTTILHMKDDKKIVDTLSVTIMDIQDNAGEMDNSMARRTALKSLIDKCKLTPMLHDVLKARTELKAKASEKEVPLTQAKTSIWKQAPEPSETGLDISDKPRTRPRR